MKNTVTYALFLLLVTGAFLTGCVEELAEEVMEEVYELEEVSGVSEVRVEVMEDEATSVEVEVVEEPLVEETAPVEEAAPEASANVFADGTYFSIASYNTPAGTHNLSVNLKIENDTIVWAQASSDGEHDESQEYTERFLSGLDARVVGVPLTDLGKIGAVNGSSLTAGGFSRALGNIEMQAREAAQ